MKREAKEAEELRKLKEQVARDEALSKEREKKLKRGLAQAMDITHAGRTDPADAPAASRACAVC